MKRWRHTVKGVTEAMTPNSDSESVKKSMNAIVAILETPEHQNHFQEFFNSLDSGVEEFKNCDNIHDANNLINELYDYCDNRRIWIAPS